MATLSNEQMLNLAKEIQDGRKLLQTIFPCPELRDWLPRHEVMQYLSFGSTQMNTIAKKYGLKTARIGKRMFYNVKQIQEILNTQLD